MTKIATRGPMGQKAAKQRGTPLERRYFKWLHAECTCVLTGYPEFEIAHTGGLSEGKGMSRKSALETCLPLRPELHKAEEAGRGEFWAQIGIPDYLDWAIRLYDIFECGEDPRALLLDMQEKANHELLVAILEGRK